MIIRSFRPEDLPQIRGLYDAKGFDYKLPKMEEFVENEVLVDEDGTIILVLAAIPTADIYMFMNSEWETPGQRFEALKLMHEHMRRKLERRKIVQVHVWLPPVIAKSFGRRLMKYFGYARPLWACFARRVF